MAEVRSESPSRRFRGRLEMDPPRSDDDDEDVEMAVGEEPDRNISPSRQRSPGKDFLCVVPGCESSFTRKYSLKLHLQRAHPEYKGPLTESSKNDRNKSVKKWMCPKAGCPSGYSRKSDLKVHLEKVHPELAATYQIFDFRGKTLREEVGDSTRRDASPTTLNFSNFRLDSGSSASSRASSPTGASRDASPAPGRGASSTTPSRLNNFNIRDVSPHPTRSDSSHASPINVPSAFPNPNSHPNIMPQMSPTVVPMMNPGGPFSQSPTPTPNWPDLSQGGVFNTGGHMNVNMNSMNINMMNMGGSDPSSNPNWNGSFAQAMVRDSSPNPMQRGMHFNHPPKATSDVNPFANSGNFIGNTAGFGNHSPVSFGGNLNGNFGNPNLANGGSFGNPSISGTSNGFGGTPMSIDVSNPGFGANNTGAIGGGFNNPVGFGNSAGFPNMGPVGGSIGNFPIQTPNGSFVGFNQMGNTFPNGNSNMINMGANLGSMNTMPQNGIFPQPGFNPQVGPTPMFFPNNNPAQGANALPSLGVIIDSTRNVSPLRIPPSDTHGSPNPHNFGVMMDAARSNSPLRIPTPTDVSGSAPSTSPFSDPSLLRTSSPLRFPPVGSEGFASDSDRSLTPTSRVRILRDVTPPRGRPSDLTAPPSTRLGTSSGSAFSPFGSDRDSSVERLRPTLHISNTDTPTTSKNDAGMNIDSSSQRTTDSSSLSSQNTGFDPMVVDETSTS